MEVSSPAMESRTSTQRLKDAVESNDIAELEILLKSGVDPNHQFIEYRRYTPLHLAAKYGHTELIDILLAAGADPSVKNKRGNTPLVVACTRNQCDIFLKLLPVTKCGDFTYNQLIERTVHDCCTWEYIVPNMKQLMFRASPCMDIYSRKFIILYHDRCLKGLIMCGKDTHDSDISRFIQFLEEEYESLLNLINDMEFPFKYEGLQENINEKRDFISFITNLKTNPPSLKHICRLSIRESFNEKCNVFYGVNKLSLPKVLKDYICFNGVDFDSCFDPQSI